MSDDVLVDGPFVCLKDVHPLHPDQIQNWWLPGHQPPIISAAYNLPGITFSRSGVDLWLFQATVEIIATSKLTLHKEFEESLEAAPSVTEMMIEDRRGEFVERVERYASEVRGAFIEAGLWRRG